MSRRARTWTIILTLFVISAAYEWLVVKDGGALMFSGMATGAAFGIGAWLNSLFKR